MCSSKSAWVEALATDSSGSMLVWFNIFRTTSTFTGRSILRCKSLEFYPLYKFNTGISNRHNFFMWFKKILVRNGGARNCTYLYTIQANMSLLHISKQQQRVLLARFWILSLLFRHLKTSWRSWNVLCFHFLKVSLTLIGKSLKIDPENLPKFQFSRSIS